MSEMSEELGQELERIISEALGTGRISPSAELGDDCRGAGHGVGQQRLGAAEPGERGDETPVAIAGGYDWRYRKKICSTA